ISDIPDRIRSEAVTQLLEIEAGWLHHLSGRIEDTAGSSADRDRRAEAAYAPVQGARRLLHQQKRRTYVPCHRPADTATLARSSVCRAKEPDTWAALGPVREITAVHQQTGGPRLPRGDATVVRAEVQDNERADRLRPGGHDPRA